MKPSNLDDVGQIRSSQGTSMKSIRKEDTLERKGLISSSTFEHSEEILKTHRHSTEKMISIALKEKMLAIPSAKHRMMQITPVLFTLVRQASYKPPARVARNCRSRQRGQMPLALTKIALRCHRPHCRVNSQLITEPDDLPLSVDT